jgi:hypothetical protein
VLSSNLDWFGFRDDGAWLSVRAVNRVARQSEPSLPLRKMSIVEPQGTVFWGFAANFSLADRQIKL